MKTFKKPDLNLTRKYDSQAVAATQLTKTAEPDLPIIEVEKSLGEKITGFIPVVKMLPAPANSVFSESLSTLKVFSQNLLNKKEALLRAQKEAEEPDYKTGSEASIEASDEFYEPLEANPMLEDIEDADGHSFLIQQELKGIEMSINVITDFVDKVGSTSTDFILNTNALLNVTGYSFVADDSELFKMKTEEIPQEYKHISDTLHRLDIAGDQKKRFIKKVCNKDELKTQLRKLNAMYEQKKRVFEISSKKEEDFIDFEDNNFLSYSQYVFEQRLDKAMLDTYKYLNSSVILVKEYLDIALQKIKAKCVLVKAGVLVEPSVLAQQSE